MKDAKKLNNLLGMEEMSADKVLGKKAKPTKRTEVAKDVLAESAYVLGKDVLGGKLPNKEFHAAKGLNNLISLEDFTKAVPATKDTPTKRTTTAKDVLKEQAYVLGKDVLGGKLPNKEFHAAKGLNNLISLEDFTKSVPATKDTPTKRTTTAKDVLKENTGKDVLGDHLKNKETHSAKGLNNLICLDDFTKSVPATKDKVTKRTETAKDVLLEKKKKVEKVEKEKDEDCDCISKKQAKLPWNKGKKIC